LFRRRQFFNDVDKNEGFSDLNAFHSHHRNLLVMNISGSGEDDSYVHSTTADSSSENDTYMYTTTTTTTTDP
jgi:hypothetical protein